MNRSRPIVLALIAQLAWSACTPALRPQAHREAPAQAEGAPAATPRPERPQAADAWLGFDKLQHLLISFGATSFAFGAASSAGVDRDAALFVSGGAALAAGLAKEVDDRSRGGGFSFKDLVWDAAGIAAAALLLSRTR